MKALSRNTEQVEVKYFVQMASPESYMEDGVEKRSYGLTGGYSTFADAERARVNLKGSTRGDWLWDVVKVTTVSTLTYEKVTE